MGGSQSQVSHTKGQQNMKLHGKKHINMEHSNDRRLSFPEDLKRQHNSVSRTDIKLLALVYTLVSSAPKPHGNDVIGHRNMGHRQCFSLQLRITVFGELASYSK